MESTGTTRQCYGVFDGRIDALRFQDAPSILRAASLSYTARGTFLAFAARKASAAVQNDAPKRTKSLIIFQRRVQAGLRLAWKTRSWW